MRILICPILLVCLLSGPGRRAVAAPVPPRLVACLPVVAQGWAVEQEGDRPARIRARSLIKLGLFVAGLIAGLITFVVRLTSRPNRDSDDQFKTPVAREIRSTERLVHQHDNGSGAEAGAAVVPRSTKTGVGLAIVAALLLLMFVAIACVAILYFGLTAATQQALNELPPVKMDQFDIEFPIPVPDPNAGRVAAEHEFEKRWNVAAANVAGDDSTQPPDAQAGEKGLTESIDGPDSMATPVSWQESDVVDSGTSISHHGMSFADVAPAEALLVGLRVTGDGRCLTSIQPVYRKGIERIDGAVHGVESETHTAELSARPGEAVAAARLELSGEVFGIQLEFGKVVDGRIKLADRYVSPLFGQRVPGNAVVIEGDGDIFVGISGKVRDGFDGLSLKRVMPLANSPDETPVAWRQTRVLSPAGRGSGTAFEDMAPEDGILVGMRFFVGRS